MRQTDECVEAGSLLNPGLQQGAGHQMQGHSHTAADVANGVGAQVGQQQLRAPVQKVEDVLSQGFHAGVAHLLQIKDVLQEEQHLVLQEQKKTPPCVLYKYSM